MQCVITSERLYFFYVVLYLYVVVVIILYLTGLYCIDIVFTVYCCYVVDMKKSEAPKSYCEPRQ